MTELKKILSIYLDLYLHQIIISGARTKEGASKIRIRPVVMKDKLYFQCTSTAGMTNSARSTVFWNLSRIFYRSFRKTGK